MKPRPFTTLTNGQRVTVIRKTHSEYSSVCPKHIGKLFTIIGIDWSGRAHNNYISSIIIQNSKDGDIRAVVDELSLLNPNFEPEGNFVVCICCGATMNEQDLKIINHLGGITACPSCGVLEPTQS